MFGFLFAERRSLLGFLTDASVLNYLFFLGLFLALDLTTTGFEPGAWLSVVSGAVTALGLRLWTRGSRKGGGAVTAVVVLALAALLFASFAPERAHMMSQGLWRSPSSERSILLDQRFLEEDRDFYKSLAENLGDDEKNCLKRGIYWLRAGSEERALEQIDRAVSLEDTAFSYAVLGRAYLESRNSLDAKEAFEQAIRQDHEQRYPEAYFWLAKSCYQVKQKGVYLRKFLSAVESKNEDIYKGMIESARKQLR